MKNLILILGLCGLLISSCSEPNAEKILKKSYEKCQTIKNGYYEMTHYMKYMSDADTTSSIYKCYFSKLPNDTIYSSAFHYQYFRDGEYKRDVLYTGEDFVRYSINDSTGNIMSKMLWAKEIKSFSHNYTFYTPITNNKSYPLPKDSAYIDNEHVFEFLGEKIINETPCYHIKINIIPTNDSTAMFKTLRAENNYWISKQDYIPIQYSLAYDLVMNNDTMYQFEKNVLTKYELDYFKDEEKLKLSSIPSHIILKDYEPTKRPELLQIDTIAPNWSLISLDDEIVKLTDFKGQMVLIDFFYKSCYPCMLALPALQDLHERYNDKGLKIIGIDPYDTKEEDDIDNFLKKRGVSYTVLLGGKDVAKKYHVSGYPTIYLIDKEGKVIFTQVGYGEGTEEKLEEVIKHNL
jgi:thiol-disulfide isomerase/thioredoxin